MNAEADSINELSTVFTDDLLNLEIMAEEAAEVAEEINTIILADTLRSLSRLGRIKSKVVRFGINDYHPKNGETNRAALATEIGHLKALFSILENRGVVDKVAVKAETLAKINKMPKWYRPLLNQEITSHWEGGE